MLFYIILGIESREIVEVVNSLIKNVLSKNKDELDSILDKFLVKNTSEDNVSFE